MEHVTAVAARNRFGELLDRAQRGPVAVTRHGRTVAYVVAAHAMPVADLAERRAQVVRWYAAYRQGAANPAAARLTDDDVAALVHEVR